VDSIIYAPTVTNDNFAEYVSVPKYGAKIVKALLEGFGDYRIIFRPHPHTLDTDDVRKIAERFSDSDRFVFDSNASFYNDNYCRSAVMVTDMSGTAFTYAFMTLRPVVFFSHREKDVAEAFGNVKYFEDRERLGYIAKNADELKQEVARALRNAGRFARRIRKFRSEVVFNIGRAEDYFAENFHCIAEGHRHEDWEYVVAPLSQSEAGLLESLHDCIEQYIEDARSLREDVKKQRTALRRAEKLIDGKDENISRLSNTISEKTDEIGRLEEAVKRKRAENSRLGAALGEHERTIEDLRAELGAIKSKWWFRLFSSAKKHLTKAEKADIEG